MIIFRLGVCQVLEYVKEYQPAGLKWQQGGATQFLSIDRQFPSIDHQCSSIDRQFPCTDHLTQELPSTLTTARKHQYQTLPLPLQLPPPLSLPPNQVQK